MVFYTAKNDIAKNNNLYACFIDLRKAFDFVCRDMLMYKLLLLGIDGKMFKILNSLYDNQKTQSCIRVNNHLSDWFRTELGVKQGDSLSPVLFLLFINDLAVELKDLGIGYKLGDRKIPILLYADDIVLLSQDPDELQKLINHVNSWCKKWLMAVNLDKTKIMHFRKKGNTRSSYEFKYDNESIKYADSYKYLGLHFDEHLSMEVDEEKLANAGKKALGSIINKLRQNDNMTYNSFTKCVNSCLYPVIEYGSEITGIYKNVKLNRVIDSAARSFIGVHRFCPIASMYKDLGWNRNNCRRKINVIRYWNKLVKMKNDRLTKQVFDYMYQNYSVGSWFYHVKGLFRKMGMLEYYQEKKVCNLDAVTEKMKLMDVEEIMKEISKKPKLRLYKQLMSDEDTELYVKLNITSSERSILAQFRMGILPLRVETGRFRNLKISDRLCQICNSGEVEDEVHFMLNCKSYTETRRHYMNIFSDRIEGFNTFDSIGKIKMCFHKAPRQLAKYLSIIFQERKIHEYRDE